MDIAHLKSMNKTIGAKQTLKQIARGTVKYVFLDVIVMNVWLSLYGMLVLNRESLNDKHTMDDLVVRVALRCEPQL